MSIVLGPNQYGKAENRVVRVYRDTARHEIRDLNVSTALRGDFTRRARRPATRPASCPPTPRRTPPSPSPRSTGSPPRRTTPSRSRQRFLDVTPRRDRQPDRGRGVRLGPHRGRRRRPRPRLRPPRRGGPHHRRHAGRQRRRAAGLGRLRLKDLVVLKSTGSEFKGFLKDEYTTLEETDDRILATSLVARWRYEATEGVDWNKAFDDIRQILLETFATTYSRALQETPLRDGPRRARGTPRGRGDQVLGAQQAPLPGRPLALRAGEPRRGVHRRRPPVRPDRGDRAAGRTPPTPATPG